MEGSVDGKKRVLGAGLLAGSAALFGHIGGTQWFAHGLAYDERFLGGVLLVDAKLGVKLYWPHMVWVWAHAYWGGRIDELIAVSSGIAGGSIVLGALLGGLVALSFKPPVRRTAHGSARWATEDEVRASEMVLSVDERIEAARAQERPLHESCSVVLGKLSDGTLLLNSGKEHLLGNAPTRSGKGVGWVIPTLLTWTGSVLVTDIKGENYQITGWWRRRFSHVVYFNPTDPNSACWNPLLEIRKGDDAIQDAMNIGEILGSASGDAGNKFWDAGAKKFLSATILYVLYTQEDKSLSKCLGLLARFEATFERFANLEIPGEPHVTEFIRSVAHGTENYSESVLGGWAAGAETALDLWRDPKVAANTARSDFRLRDLQYAEHPLSVYMVIPPPDLERLSPLVRLFFQQATDALTADGVEDQGNRHRLLMMMDEFPQFGRMDKIQRAIAYTAGYDIKWFFIVQGLNQLADRALYGPENAFLSNCHTRLAYRCNDPDNADSLRQMLGTTTGYKDQEGESGSRGIVSSLNKRQVSHIEYERDLMTVGELQQMDSSRVLVMNAGENPIKAYKVTYYDDPRFIPKFKNKQLPFPTTPLTDFPPQDPGANPWSGLRQEAQDDADLLVNVATLKARIAHEASSRGEDMSEGAGVPGLVIDDEPPGLPKVSAERIDELTRDIPVELGPGAAAVHMTTNSITRGYVQEVVSTAVRAGLLPADRLELFNPTPTATDEDHASRPIEPFEPFGEHDVFDDDPFADDPLEGSEPAAMEDDDDSQAPIELGFEDSLLAQMGLTGPPEHEGADENQGAMGHGPRDLEDVESAEGTVVIEDMESYLAGIQADVGWRDDDGTKEEKS